MHFATSDRFLQITLHLSFFFQAKFAESTQVTAEEKAKYEAKVAEKIKLKASSFYASSRMWNDGIILPHQTRKVRPRNMRQR